MFASRKIGLAAFRTRTYQTTPAEELSPAMQRIRALATDTVKWSLLVLSLLGTSFTLADGLLTPAVSVTSAVEGLALVTSLEVGKQTMGIAMGVLIVLFAAQRFGTSSIGRFYSPVVAIWVAWLGATGIAMIVEQPGIWRAVNPVEMVRFFIRTKDYFYLGPVMLAISGSEALYAAVGQFAPNAVRISFIGFVWPCLVLQYLGQGALLIAHPEVIENVFFSSSRHLGEAVFYISFVTSILATIVASQALITAAFSLLQQLIAFRCMPPFRIRATSDEHCGQVYISAANWLICAGTLAITGGFQTSERITHAYTFTIACVMIITTLLLALSMRAVKHLSWPISIAFFLISGTIDGLFLGASARKFVTGAWVPVAISLFLATFFVSWFWLKNLEQMFDVDHHTSLSDLLSYDPADSSRRERGGIYSRSSTISKARYSPPMSRTVTTATTLSPRPIYRHRSSLDKPFGDADITDSPLASTRMSRDTSGHTMTPVPEIDDTPLLGEPALPLDEKAEGKAELGMLNVPTFSSPLYLVGHPHGLKLERISCFALFHSPTAPQGAPAVLQAFVHRWPALPRVCCFATVRVVALPHVEEEDRWLITKWRQYPGFYTVVYRLGFRDLPDLRNVHLTLGKRLIAMEERRGDAMTEENIAAIQDSAKKASIHVFSTFVLTSAPSEHSKYSFAGIMHGCRRILLDVMQRLSQIWPESDLLIVEDNVLRVSVAAKV